METMSSAPIDASKMRPDRASRCISLCSLVVVSTFAVVIAFPFRSLVVEPGLDSPRPTLENRPGVGMGCLVHLCVDACLFSSLLRPLHTRPDVRRVEMSDQVRLAELLGSFAFAGDLGQGQSLGHVLSTTQVASRLAERLNLPADQQADVFYTALLLHSGCTAGASDMAAFLLNDELAAQAELCLFDPDNV